MFVFKILTIQKSLKSSHKNVCVWNTYNSKVSLKFSQKCLWLKYLQFKSLLKVWIQCCHPHPGWPKHQIDQSLKLSQFQKIILTLVRRRLKLSQCEKIILTLVRRRLKLSLCEKIILTLVRRRLKLSQFQKIILTLVRRSWRYALAAVPRWRKGRSDLKLSDDLHSKLLSQIYALSNVKFVAWNCRCIKKDKYEV